MNNIKRIKLIGLLFLLGTPSYFLCTGTHICMGGHLAHPIYPIWNWISEYFWLTSYTSVVVFSLRAKVKRKFWCIFGGLFILISRIVLGSGGGMLFFIELPIVIYLVFVSFKYIWKNHVYVTIKTEQTSGADGV
jgi:hypothetical protein